MRKRFAAFLLLFATVLSFASCGGKQSAATVRPTTDATDPAITETATVPVTVPATAPETVPRTEYATTAVTGRAEDVTVYGNGVLPAVILPSTSIPADGAVSALCAALETSLGKAPLVGSDGETGKTGVEIVIGPTERAISARANALLPPLDGDEAAYVILFDGDGAALVWNHECAAERAIACFTDVYLNRPTLTVDSGTYCIERVSIAAYEEELRVKEEERRAEIDRLFETRFDVIADPDVREAVRGFYEEFFDPEALIRWWASLYDPDLGGFYYADSARDHDGFLPDMESTYQILWRLKDFVPDLKEYLGSELTEKIVTFFQTKQDPDDGYFYHPQWTREESRKNVMRYSRDQDWAIFVLDWLGAKPLYPTALDRAANEGGETTSPEWEPSEPSVSRYLSKLFNNTTCEHWANQIETQATTFKATGMLGYVLDILDARVNPDYGLWVKSYDADSDTYHNLKTKDDSETPYGLYTNAYKIAKCYNIGGRRIPYALKMVENGIKAIKSRNPGIRVTYLFNPWATLGNVRENLVNYGTPEEVAQYDALIRENIVEMIDALGASLGLYRCEDGSYSFLQAGSSPTIYSTKVSLGLKEGDVNGNNLVVLLGTHISAAVGLSEPIPIFSENHASLMKELLVNAPKIKKGAENTATVAVGFEGDAVGAAPGKTTESKVSGTTFLVAADPTDPSGRVLEIRKDTETAKKGGTLTVPTLTVPKMYNTTALEIKMRLYVSSETRFGSETDGRIRNVLQIRMTSGDRLFWLPTLRFNSEGTGYELIVKKSPASNYFETPSETTTFEFDRWYEFTFRLTVKDYGTNDASFRVGITVDDEPFGTSLCFASDDASSLTSGEIGFREGKEIAVSFVPESRVHALIYVDDLSATYSNGN